MQTLYLIKHNKLSLTRRRSASFLKKRDFVLEDSINGQIHRSNKFSWSISDDGEKRSIFENVKCEGSTNLVSFFRSSAMPPSFFFYRQSVRLIVVCLLPTYLIAKQVNYRCYCTFSNHLWLVHLTFCVLIKLTRPFSSLRHESSSDILYADVLLCKLGSFYRHIPTVTTVLYFKICHFYGCLLFLSKTFDHFTNLDESVALTFFGKWFISDTKTQTHLPLCPLHINHIRHRSQ